MKCTRIKSVTAGARLSAAYFKCNTISCVSGFTSSSALPSNKPQKTETNHTIPHVLKNFI